MEQENQKKIRQLESQIEDLEESIQTIRDRCFQVFEELETNRLIEDNPFHWDNLRKL